MRHEYDTPITVYDVLRCLVRHRWKIGAVFVACVAASIAWAVFAPRTYESEAKLYVRLGRESLTLDPTATTGETVTFYQTRESEVNTTLELIESRSMAAAVVERLGVDTVLGLSAKSDRGPGASSRAARILDSMISAVKRLDPESDRQRAIRKIQSCTTIWAPANTSVISIYCTASSPRLAQRIAEGWTEVFLGEYLRLTRTAGSHQFFVDQVAAFKSQLAEAEQRLREARVQAGLLSIEGQQGVLEQDLGAIRAKMTANAPALDSSKAKAQELGATLKAMSPEIVLQDVGGMPHQAWDMMRDKLYQLEIHEGELRSKFTDKHPLVAATDRQRQGVEGILAAQAESRSQSVRGPNPTYQALQRELLDEQAAVAALIAENESLRGEHARIQKEFEAFNAQVVRIDDLEREVEILDEKYRTHAGNMEMARVQEALEHERISSINVVQPADFVERPASPRKATCLLIGLAVGWLGGIGVALTAEYLSRSRATSSQLEAALGLPVRASLPRSPSSRIAASVK